MFRVPGAFWGLGGSGHGLSSSPSDKSVPIGQP